MDNIFDLPRILRVPGTFNCKGLNGEDPIPVIAHEWKGRHLDLDEVDLILRGVGVLTEPEDTRSHEQVSAPEDWKFGLYTCPYVAKIVNAIPTDTPRAGRHQWMVSKCVKLACAARRGCITDADFDRATAQLYAQLVALREQTYEEVPHHEVPTAVVYAIERASCKTDEETLAELGNHRCLKHTPPNVIRDGSAGAHIIRKAASR